MMKYIKKHCKIFSTQEQALGWVLQVRWSEAIWAEAVLTPVFIAEGFLEPRCEARYNEYLENSLYTNIGGLSCLTS